MPGVTGEAWEVLVGQWNFAVTSIDLPLNTATMTPAMISGGLDGGVRGMEKTLKASTKSSTDVNLNGFAGKEVVYAIPAGPNITTGRPEPATTAIMRVFLVNSKMYLLIVRTTNSITKDSGDVRTFFDSFKLNASATPSTTNMAGPPGGMPGGMPGGHPGMNAPAQTAAAGGNPGAIPGANPTSLPNSTPAPGFNADGTRTGGFAPPAADPANPALAGMTPTPTTSLPTSNLPNSGITPLPNSTRGAAGTTTKGGFSQPAEFGAGNPSGPTRTPVTADTKLEVGDTVSIEFGGQWADAKVERVDADGGVQIRRLQPPLISNKVPRSVLHKVSGAIGTQMAEADAPEPAKLPQTKSSGFTNSGDSSLPKSAPTATKTAKSRSAGFAKPASNESPAAGNEPKAEAVKSAGLVSLDGASVDDLLRVIGKKNEHRKALAAEKLRDHSEAAPNPDVAKKIVDVLKSSNELTVRAAIAQALEKWASPEIHDDVVKNLTGGTTEVRQSMIRILAATNAEDAADRIANCLPDKDDRKVATETLISLGEPAQAAVIKMLNHRDSKVKTAACDILKEIGTADSIPALTKATSDWTGTDRLAARKALKSLEAKK